MKTISLDATILTSLMGCPRASENRFIKLQVPSEGKSNSIECGSLAHVILEFTNLSLMAGLSKADAQKDGFVAGDLFINGCPFCKDKEYTCQIPQHKNEWLGLKNTPEKSDKKNIGWSYVIDTMHQYFDYWRSDDFIHVGVEETRGKIIYQDSEIQILWKAKFDDIFDTPDGMQSRDYKTMKQRRDTLSLNNQFMGQCLILGARKVMIDKIGFQSSLKAEEKFVRINIPYSIDRLMEFAHEIVPYYARMLLAYTEANYFPPNYTHCETKYGFCDYVHICELNPSLREEAFKVNFIKGKEWDV